MKNKNLKILFVFLLMFLMTGCAKTLVDKDKKPVKYEASIICDNCLKSCEKIEKQLNNKCSSESKKDDECIKDEDTIKKLEEDLKNCKNNCDVKCEIAKKNETGQNLISNVLCRPTNKDVLEIYEINGVDIESLEECRNFKVFSDYEGLWISLFVRPLAWLIIKTGILFNNYGLALVIISLLIRLVLMPLTKKTAMQSENIKKAQPEIDRINKKYENKVDQQSQMQKSQETLMIYKKYDINPFASCLFALIQIPLLFAFIEAINRTPAIFEGKFLGLNLGITPWTALKGGEWWYLILVIVLAVVTYFSLNFNKNDTVSKDDMQNQMNMMNKIMLVFIVYASFTLSTAICMYWIVSSSFTILQNLLVKRVK